MRESSGMTQAQVATASGLAQPEISKLEAATSFDGRMVETLRRYLAAIGDELELVSVSKHGHRIGVVGVEESRETDAADTQPGPLFTALAGLQGEMAAYSVRGGERWRAGTRLLEALRGALLAGETHAAKGKPRRSTGRDPVAVLLRSAVEKLDGREASRSPCRTRHPPRG